MLDNLPSKEFSFKEWQEFLEEIISSESKLAELVLEKMADAAETEEDKLNLLRIEENLLAKKDNQR